MNAFEHVKEACRMKRKGHTANTHDAPPETSSDRAEQSHYFSHFEASFLVSACLGREIPTFEPRKSSARPADHSQTGNASCPLAARKTFTFCLLV